MLTPLVCLLFTLPLAARPAPETARTVVARAIDALGGEAALKRIQGLDLESIGHDYFIDQSERPEGPFIVSYATRSERRDVAGSRSRMEQQQRFVLSPDWSPADATLVDGDAAAMLRNGRYLPGGRQAFEDGRERLELAPERLLLTALAAPDLAGGSPAMLHGIPQQMVTFTWRGRHARLSSTRTTTCRARWRSSPTIPSESGAACARRLITRCGRSCLAACATRCRPTVSGTASRSRRRR
jgi:hypothetical protein